MTDYTISGAIFHPNGVDPLAGNWYVSCWSDMGAALRGTDVLANTTVVPVDANTGNASEAFPGTTGDQIYMCYFQSTDRKTVLGRFFFTLTSNTTWSVIMTAPSALPEDASDALIQLAAHINNPTGAHAATAIGFTPTGTIASTNVQAAIAEVAAEAAAGGTVTASDVTYGGSPNLSATNVEAALDELDAEKQAADVDLSAIAALDSATAGALVTDGAGWIRKTYAQLKAALVLTKGDVGLGNVDNTSDVAKPISTATATALTGKADLVGGVVPTSQIPAIALTTGQVVANRAALVALVNVQQGDIGVISGTSDKGTYILTTADPTAFGNWLLLNAPTDLVSSVNGQTGTVVLGAADVNAQPADTDLTAIAGLDAASAGAIASDGAGWVKKTYAQFKTALGLVKADVGLGNVDNLQQQPIDPTLTALAALATGANQLPYSTGTDTFAQTALTAFIRTLLDDPDAKTGRTTLGVNALLALQYPSMLSGNYYVPPGSTSTGSGNGTQRGVVFVPGADCTINEIAAEVVTAGSAGSLIRLGIYAWDAVNQTATSLLVDAGTIPGDVVAVAGLTISLAMTAFQPYLLTATTQGTLTTQPVLRTANAVDNRIGQTNRASSTSVSYGNGAQLGAGTTTGALPAGPISGLVLGNGAVPRVAVHVQ